MLQKVEFEDDFQPLQEDRSHLLRPAFYWELFKRRWAYFVLPFVTILAAGAAVALLWPPTYLSEGRILVQSQQIPSELVRPTVTSAAQERIQVIQQRTMTRDNLIAIADKFKLFPDKRTLMSATELVARSRRTRKSRRSTFSWTSSSARALQWKIPRSFSRSDSNMAILRWLRRSPTN